MRARLLVHACETTVTPAHDEPLEEQAARAPTNSGYARNGTLFPQVYRAAAPPFASKNSHSMVFFALNGTRPDAGMTHDVICGEVSDSALPCGRILFAYTLQVTERDLQVM